MALSVSHQRREHQGHANDKCYQGRLPSPGLLLILAGVNLYCVHALRRKGGQCFRLLSHGVFVE